jgi:hypothetical protein
MTSAQSRQTKRGADAVSGSLIKDYSEEVRRQREVWLNKPVLRLLYNNWYSRCAAQFSGQSPVVEIGAGSRNFKSSYPDVISTDVFATGPWIDLVMDAHALALGPSIAGTFSSLTSYITCSVRSIFFARRWPRLSREGGWYYASRHCLRGRDLSMASFIMNRWTPIGTCSAWIDSRCRRTVTANLRTRRYQNCCSGRTGQGRCSYYRLAGWFMRRSLDSCLIHLRAVLAIEVFYRS